MLTIFAKYFILYILQSSKYASGLKDILKAFSDFRNKQRKCMK